MVDEETAASLEELGWDLRKLAEVAGYYDTATKVSLWKRAGRLPNYIKALLDAHVRIHRLVLYGNDSKTGTPAPRQRRKVTAADIEAYFARQNADKGDR